tara:strand:+ start:799 stop:1524 length:726 start_codon:yes stop_codon:yes gene_type:complete
MKFCIFFCSLLLSLTCQAAVNQCGQIFRSTGISNKEKSFQQMIEFITERAVETIESPPVLPTLRVAENYKEQIKTLQDMQEKIRTFIDSQPSAAIVIQRWIKYHYPYQGQANIWQSRKVLSKKEQAELTQALKRLSFRSHKSNAVENYEKLYKDLVSAVKIAEHRLSEQRNWEQLHQRLADFSPLYSPVIRVKTETKNESYWKLTDVLLAQVKLNENRIEYLQDMIHALEQAYPGANIEAL